MQVRPAPDALVAVAMLLQAVVLGAVALGSFWVADDLLWLTQAATPLDWGYLAKPVFNSFVPVLRAGYWPVTQYLDAAYTPVAVLETLMELVVTWQTWRVCTLCVGRSWPVALAVAFSATSPLWVPDVIWAADGLHMLPFTIASLLAIEGYLRHAIRAPHATRWLVASSLGILVAFGCSSKAVLLCLLLAGMRVLLLARSPREVLRDAAVWGVLAIPAALYLLQITLSSNYYGRGTPLPVNWGHLPDLVRIMWSSSFVPGWLGIGHLQPKFGVNPSDEPALAATPVWIVLAGQLAFVAALAASVARRRAAWRPWALLAMLVVGNALLLLYGREAQFGVTIGREYRYVFDLLPVATLLVLIAFLPSRLVEGHPLSRAAAPLGPGARRGLVAGAAVLLGVHVGWSIVNARSIARAWPVTPIKRYYASFDAATDALQREHATFHVFDVTPPREVLNPRQIIGAPASVALGVVHPDVDFRDDGAGRGYVIGADGSLRPGALEVEARAAGGQRCASAGREVVRLRFGRTLPVADHRLAFAYRATAPRGIDVRWVRPGGRTLPLFQLAGSRVALEAGAHRFRAIGRRVSVTGVELALASGVCVSDLAAELPRAG